MDDSVHHDQLDAPLDTCKFVMPDGHEYEPGEDGTIAVQDQSHVATLRALGCTVPGDAATQISTVAEAPPEDLAALVTENATLAAQVRTLTDQLEEAVNKLEAAHNELSASQLVESHLVDRVQELEGRLAASGSASEDAPATDIAQEAGEASGDTSSGQDGAIQTVEGVLVEGPEAFDAAEYNFLKAWAHAHGVHLPASVKKTVAIQACKDRFAELTAPKE